MVKEISQSSALHVPNKNSPSSDTRDLTPTLAPNFLRSDGWLTPPRPREGSREVNKLLPVSSLHLRRLREHHLQATHPNEPAVGVSVIQSQTHVPQLVPANSSAGGG
ncbi:CCAAT/enhancer-binding protein gamma isoform X1 [Hippoglossus hippoglossus]|uniref:CCAAT/enhancer-binding protein gamma isoform X1 n=1 Tax=Hippoglossus hippoglossus TaxID=8267 RepID=UPI00148C0D06|nr:CCAAT/enhancer-binding protein gamma isoform X1 [Hippoglossus hippoglossus]